MNSGQMNQENVADHRPQMTMKYGKTLYRLYFQFDERGKQTMNDKVLKLIRSNSFVEPDFIK